MAAAGIVAGSGMDLRPVLDEVVEERPFASFTGLAGGDVDGHPCTLIRGRCAGVPVILQCGRRHLYEGLSFEELVQSVDVLHGFGVETLLLTNAAGALQPELPLGAIVAATRVISWPCARLGLPKEMTPGLVPEGTHRGSYAWMHGPCYETRAEIAALQRLGGAVVGMSAAPELLRCQQLGMRAGILSCVTNVCAAQQILTHEHVLASARDASMALCGILRKTISGLAPVT